MLGDQSKSPPKTPRQLWVGIVLAVVLAIAIVWLGFLALPSLKPEYQAFWSGLVGSFVGSAVAFAGAAWLWRMERHILVDERTADRLAVRQQELKREDARTLRDCVSIIGNLQALNFHMRKEELHATVREKYLMQIRFSEAVSLINDDALRGELEFMSRLVSEDQDLDYMVESQWLRLNTVHDWLPRLISLDETKQLTDARPDNYEKLRSDLATYDAYREEQWQAMTEYEEARKAEAQAAKQAIKEPGSKAEAAEES